VACPSSVLKTHNGLRTAIETCALSSCFGTGHKIATTLKISVLTLLQNNAIVVNARLSPDAYSPSVARDFPKRRRDLILSHSGKRLYPAVANVEYLFCDLLARLAVF
jgi:hypothetical protein